jgi:hypothetical protein
MTIKKVTVKFDTCGECPVYRYNGCPSADGGNIGEIPADCPIDASVMMHRYTEFSTSRSVDREVTPTEYLPKESQLSGKLV